MDAWLKSAVQQATKLSSELQELVEGTPDGGNREVEFSNGALGFELEGLRVSAVDRDGQAARLGVRVGDRLLAVAGYEVPMPKKWSEDSEKRAAVQVKKWLKDLPRPGRLTFLPVERDEAAEATIAAAAAAPGVPATAAAAATAGTASSAADGDKAAVAPEGGEAMPSQDEVVASSVGAAIGLAEQLAHTTAELQAEKDRVSALTAELYIAQEQNRSVEGELQEARRECQVLRHMAADHDDGVGTAQSRVEVQLRSLQDQLARARAEAEAARKKAAELQARLSAAEERCEELRQAEARAEEVAREANEGRELVLEEEVARLRAVHSAAEAEGRAAAALAAEHIAALDVRSQEFQEELRVQAARHAAALMDAEARAAAAEAGAAAAARELCASRDAHAAAMEEARVEREEAMRRLQAELDKAGAGAAARELCASHDARAAATEEARVEREEATRHVQLELGKVWSPDSDSEEEAGGGGGADGTTGGVVAGLGLGGGGGVEAALSEAGRATSSTAAPIPAAVATTDAEPRATAEVADLRERVQQLERRCCLLQKKLNQRPIVFQAPVRSVADGDPEGGVLQLYGAPDRLLRAFTQRLLKRGSWLRAFYAHILVLYAIAASWYVQTTTDPTSPSDALVSGGVVQQRAAAVAFSAAAAAAAGGG